MLGLDAVTTAVPVGGRTPVERVQWVPWGEPRETPGPAGRRARWDRRARGRVQCRGPRPRGSSPRPSPRSCSTAKGGAVTVSGRGEQSAAPAALRCAELPGGGGRITSWVGPWLHDVRWWERRARSRRALWQVVVACDDGERSRRRASALRASSSSRAAAPRSRRSTTDASLLRWEIRRARGGRVRRGA